jgi:carbon storage regulator
MLVLTRRVGESVVIDGGIRVTVVAIRGDKVRLGITAPDSVRVDRQEVHDRVADLTGLSPEPTAIPPKLPRARRPVPLPR